MSVAGAEIDVPPIIERVLVEPSTYTPVVSGSATFTVEASGTPPLAFQWEFNVSPIPGATNPVLRLAPLHREDAEIYHVVVSNRRLKASMTPLP